MRGKVLASLCSAMLLSGCKLAPHYFRPAAAIPATWPQGIAYGPVQPGRPGLPWRTLYAHPGLQTVIEQALAGNRDVRASLANVAKARAIYHVERSYQLPTIKASTDASISQGIRNSGLNFDTYNAAVGMSSFEIDLFGRLRNQTSEAFETYLSTQSGLRSARLTLVAEVATAYATFAADHDLLKVSQDTVASGARSLTLTRSLFESGLASDADVQASIAVVEQARSDVAEQTTLIAQDRNALELLVGARVSDGLLPASLADLDGTIGSAPAGLSSTILLNRPDVLEAEHQLKSANAAIGVAHAAFFPTITLTSAIGMASNALSSLFTGGALQWTVAPSASIPLRGGPNRGNLQFAIAQRDYYRAEYEKAVQSAFSDVANALARRGTIATQRAAQDGLVVASARAYSIANTRYRAGTDTLIGALSNQRVLYAAQRTRVEAILTDITCRISLYAAIGADESL